MNDTPLARAVAEARDKARRIVDLAAHVTERDAF